MRVLLGTPASPGYGEGVVFRYRRREYLYSAARSRPGSDRKTELRRMEAARQGARLELKALVRNLQDLYSLEEGQIFQAHFLILDDDHLTGLIRERIDKGRSAEAAVAEAVEEIEEIFSQQANPYLRERSSDIHDVGSRILNHLVDRRHHPFAELPDCSIIVADELLPSDTVFLVRGKVQAIVTERGSQTSHAAILSRAFGIPAVTGVTGIMNACRTGEAMAVNGETGRVVLGLEGRERADYGRRARGYRVAVEEIHKRPDRAVTLDGVEVSLLANVDREDDIDAALDGGAAGIGLLRTEILYLAEGGHASEGRQEEVFRYAARRMAGHPVNVRIVDAGPDKPLSLSGDTPLAGAAIPDCGLHYALAHPEILRPQLRAILRAADDGNIRILLPGITGVDEIEAFHRLLQAVADELRSERGRSLSPLPVGAMIETPSAVFMLEDIANSVDFLSVGTNDLLRHFFGRERGRVKETGCEPSLLRAVDMIVRAAAKTDREIAVCGEVAGDPAYTSILLGMGVRRFSMSPPRLPEVRYNISLVRESDAKLMASRALLLRSSLEIEKLALGNVDPWHRLLLLREEEA